MKCRSCKDDVPPKFVHAISVNICPLCGQEIMDIRLQTILNDLKSVMEKTPEFSEEIYDWLFSNYNLKKYDPKEAQQQQQQKPSSKPFQMHRDVDAESEGDAVVDIENDMTPFARRAGMNNFKKVIEHIRGGGGGAADPSEFAGQDEEYGDVFVEDNAVPLDSSGKKEIMQIFKEPNSQALEIEKLKKMRGQAAITGGGGLFRR